MQHLLKYLPSADLALRASKIAFVPTMGALHQGHLSLVKQAKTLAEQVVMSIFINPTQFESVEDLDKYPRTLIEDIKLAEAAGVDILWTPEVSEIYPDKYKLIDAGELGRIYEGHTRAGHFDGVLTVVNRLFEIVKPDFAIFGEKDFQQLFLIREFSKRTHPEIEIVSARTIREISGLAFSSRNVRLSSEQAKSALVISRALDRASKKQSYAEMKDTALAELTSEIDFKLDYFAIVNPKSLLEVDQSHFGPVQLLVAGWVGSVRLIDNLAAVIEPEGQSK
ncbi:MAG: pantoate--beta-alanine ligase [Actinobacteria bacterium]|nr:pantoate--beta-alanine ligase [Actinomycetota bacterium]